jgi:hypothetical protein
MASHSHAHDCQREQDTRHAPSCVRKCCHSGAWRRRAWRRRWPHPAHAWLPHGWVRRWAAAGPLLSALAGPSPAPCRRTRSTRSGTRSARWRARRLPPSPRPPGTRRRLLACQNLPRYEGRFASTPPRSSPTDIDYRPGLPRQISITAQVFPDRYLSTVGGGAGGRRAFPGLQSRWAWWLVSGSQGCVHASHCVSLSLLWHLPHSKGIL